MPLRDWIMLPFQIQQQRMQMQMNLEILRKAHEKEEREAELNALDRKMRGLQIKALEKKGQMEEEPIDIDLPPTEEQATMEQVEQLQPGEEMPISWLRPGRRETMPLRKAKGIFGTKLGEAAFPELFPKKEKPFEFASSPLGIFSKRTSEITKPAPPKETIPIELKQFEIETGMSPDLRGSKPYQAAINEWRKEKKEVLQITSPFEQGKFSASLRKEFENLKPVKDFRDVIQKYSVMQKAYKESEKTKNFVAVDQALITLFNKMTDPESVVRESEYARTASDLALWNRLKGKVEKFKAGGAGLTQDDRKALMTMASKFLSTYNDIYQSELERYKGYASQSGITPQSVVPNIKMPEITQFEEKTIIRKGKEKSTGRSVIEYNDGSIEYAE